ncbi:putative ribonuclease H-like domain-containing protein [Tanacetum coccineum]
MLLIKEEQHQMQDNEKDLQDELEMLVTQELVAKAMDDVSRQAFEEEKKGIASQNKAAQATSTSQLSIDRPSVSTDRLFVSTDRSFVSTDRSNTPNVSASSISTGANADESSFVYLGGNIPIDASTLPNADLPIDPNMPALEDVSDTLPNDKIFNGAYNDDEDVGAEADFNNMDNTIAASPIPTLRIHKDHPKGQILGDPTSTVQIRGKIQKASSVQQALVSYIHRQNKTNRKDHQNCLFACFLSQEEPNTISQALQDESWVEAMQEELLQFKLQKVWVLVDFPYGKKKGIDYDEVFAPVARIEEIRLFLAFASYMGFTVYQIDVKSAFLNGTIKEEVYVHQPSGFVDLAHPNKVYKVIKALYGLHQAPRAWYKTLSSFLMEKGFRRGTIDKTLFIKKKKSDIITATTPIESNKPLVKDEDGIDVDVHVYRSMIVSLTYLIPSRLDIMFDVCACTRFQVTPKASHLNAVKRIFRYLKHQPKLGLWYPRDSPFELEAYSDSDYGGASLDRKSTTGGCQFLGRRLISWQCKKQTIVANSTTKAEYVLAANCCGQVLWIQNQMMDYGFNFMNTKIHIDNESTISVIKNLVAHSRTKHIEIRFHFIRDCYEKRLIEVIKIHTDHNVADLLTKGFDVTRISMDLRMDRSWAANSSYSWSKPNESVGFTEVVDFLKGTSLRGYAGDFVPLLPAMLAGAAMDLELMDIVPKLVTRIETLETELQQTKTTYGKAVLTLVKRRIHENEREFNRFYYSYKSFRGGSRRRYSPTILEEAKTLSKVASQGVSKVKSTDKGKRYRRRARSVAKNINTGLDAEEEINTGREEINIGIEEISTGSTKVDSGTASKRGQREGKAPMVEEDIQATHKTKEQIRQEEAGLEEAIKLQAQMDEEVAKQIHLDEMVAKRMAEEEALSEQQKKRKAQVQFEAQYYTEEDWDAIRAKLEANAELTKDVLGKDLPEQDFAKRMVDMVNQRKKHFAEERAKAKRNKPMTQSQLRIYMSNYLKNQGTWKLSQLKKLSFEE